MTDQRVQAQGPVERAGLDRLGQAGAVRGAAGWVAWHAGELAAVGIPAAGAVTISVWLWALVGLSGGLWASHELRQSRQRRALLTEQDPAVGGAVEAMVDEDREVRHG